MLLELYGYSEAAGNRRLRNILESAVSPEIKTELPDSTTPSSDFVTKALDEWSRHDVSLVDFRKAIIRNNDSHRDRIDRYFAPALAYQAFRDAEIDAVNEDAVFADPNLVSLVSLVNEHAGPDGPAALREWLQLFAPLVTPGTETLPPPVLYLTLCGNRLTHASLRSVVIPPVDLQLDSSPGAIGIEFRDKADLVKRIRRIALEAVRRFGNKWKLSAVKDLTLVIDADPGAVGLHLETSPVRGEGCKLESWMAGVAWWPQIDGIPVQGTRHDGPLPAPGDEVVRWDAISANHDNSAQYGSLGVWADPGEWSPDCNCSILGEHGARYFAVLANNSIDELLNQIHPEGAPAPLHQLFESIRSPLATANTLPRAHIVWTDSRYLMEPGEHLP
ncbi:MAG: hypothetical protein R6X02_24710 [Enhygromyxa sp.]